ncbi:unnamed protein product [Trichobilharzia regenti]|nr:unnamed protein product [Trichobilharzia regenti]
MYYLNLSGTKMVLITFITAFCLVIPTSSSNIDHLFKFCFNSNVSTVYHRDATYGYSVYTRRGDTFTLCCERYYWYKNGQYFNWAANTGRYTKWPDHGTLVIARPGTDDDGMYQCIAKNQFGTALSVIVNVKRAELGDFKMTREQEVHVRLGQSEKLSCQVPVGYPQPVVTWQTEKNAQIHYLKETNRRATDINGYLYIATVTQEDDNTLYTCVANNEVLRIQKSGPSYRLRVSGQPLTYPLKTEYRSPRKEDAAVGDIIQLRCIYSGYPEPLYTWFKDDSEKITVRIFVLT